MEAKKSRVKASASTRDSATTAQTPTTDDDKFIYTDLSRRGDFKEIEALFYSNMDNLLDRFEKGLYHFLSTAKEDQPASSTNSAPKQPLAQLGQPSSQQKPPLGAKLPLFGHGIKGLMNKIVWGNHRDNPMWKNNEHLSLASNLWIEKQIDDYVNNFDIIMSESFVPVTDAMQRYVGEFKKNVKAIAGQYSRSVHHLVKKITEKERADFSKPPVKRPPRVIPTRVEIPDEVKQTVPGQVEPERLPDILPEPAPRPADAPMPPEEQAPVIDLPLDDGNPKPPSWDDKDAKKSKKKPKAVVPAEAPPVASSKPKTKETDAETNQRREERNAKSDEFMKSVGLSYNDLPPKDSPDYAKKKEAMVKTRAAIKDMFDYSTERIFPDDIEAAKDLMQQYGLDPSNPSDVVKMWPYHKYDGLTESLIPLAQWEEASAKKAARKILENASMETKVSFLKNCLKLGL